MTGIGRRDRIPSARSLVTISRDTMPITAPQNRRRLPALSILFLGFAVDAESCVGQRVQPVESDLLTALLALAEFFRILVEPAQRLIHVPQVAAFLRREQERLLALHGIGALV